MITLSVFFFKCHSLPLSTAQCQKRHKWNKAEFESKRAWQQGEWQEKCQIKFQLSVVYTAGDAISRFKRLTATRSLPADALWSFFFSVALLFELDVALGPIATLIHHGYRSMPRQTRTRPKLLHGHGVVCANCILLGFFIILLSVWGSLGFASWFLCDTPSIKSFFGWRHASTESFVIFACLTLTDDYKWRSTSSLFMISCPYTNDPPPKKKLIK